MIMTLCIWCPKCVEERVKPNWIVANGGKEDCGKHE